MSYLLNDDQNKFYKAAIWQIVVITINRFRTRDKKPTFTADVALNFSKFVSILCSRTSLMSSIRDLTYGKKTKFNVLGKTEMLYQTRFKTFKLTI